MNKLSIAFKHFKTICKHKYWVNYYCKICGIRWRGFKHDLSKFSPKEFCESIHYYTGVKSPIDTCKETKGYSLAWQHHKGRNDHHFEYWIDFNGNETKPIRMPLECALEMICDYLGAGHAYSSNAKKKFYYRDELEWFAAKIDAGCIMHKDTKKFVYLTLRSLATLDNAPIYKDKTTIKYILKDKFLDKESLERLYNYATELSDEKFELIRKSTEKKEVNIDV